MAGQSQPALPPARTLEKSLLKLALLGRSGATMMSMLTLKMLRRQARKAFGQARIKRLGNTEKNSGLQRAKSLPKDAPSKGTFPRAARFTTRPGPPGILVPRSRQQKESVGFVTKQKPLQQGGALRIGTERTPQRPNSASLQDNFVIQDYTGLRIQNTNETTDSVVFSSAFPNASDRPRSLPDHELRPAVAVQKPPRRHGRKLVSSCAKLELLSTPLLLQEHF